MPPPRMFANATASNDQISRRQAARSFAANYVKGRAEQVAANAKLEKGTRSWWSPKPWHNDVPNYTNSNHSRKRSRQSRRNRSNSRKSRRKSSGKL